MRVVVANVRHGGVPHRLGRTAAGLALTAGLVAGCASFDDSASKPFTPVPELAGPSGTTPPPPPTGERPTGPCIDPDPAVVVSCLDVTGGVTALPDGRQGLVTERLTGRILQIMAEDPTHAPPPPVQMAKLDVDSSGDGGLTGITISPSYNEDGLVYAYLTTASDNRIVRLGADGIPKPILTGIPKGATGNSGAIDFVSPTKMVVLTGDTGNPAAAADPGSLAGKLLEIDNPAPGNSHPNVLAAGIGTAGGVCPDQDGIWFTDRTAAADRLQRIDKSGGTPNVAWTWPDHPGVAGCAVTPNGVAVALTGGKAMALAAADPQSHAVTVAPTLLAQNKYGALNGASLGLDGSVWVGTVNKSGQQPGEFDDRVVRIPPPSGSSGGSPD
ncbi:PQQ-dependent sugar dehydrogenase [Nocardia stercoris]|uniref:Oxidoreductase n=1 Tax=Nocardia stercoris TaxID=2483361 RepID=A0A3M2LDA7_9NOCA|nr:PQQ-dependent sugar dehydrogenase [Nocardia stercoris]RMI35452.1 oxidoreductase [Nocardia stercoris]